MAACNVDDLLSDACDNKFLCVAADERLSLALIGVLLRTYSGTTQTAAEILADAVDNHFYAVAADDRRFQAMVAQLLCDSGG